MSSFIETTLPPGYRFAGWERGEWRWQSGDQIDRFGCFARHTCCRRAWRHWTATVLRGRVLSASQAWGRQVATANATVFYNPMSAVYYVNAEPSLEEDADGDREYTPIAKVTDADEAMARFAWLVGAMEGMVPR